MSQQQIILPEESEILGRIRNKFFPSHKLYRTSYYKSLTNCAPYLKQTDSYNVCTKKIDQTDKKAHQALQSQLNSYEEKYRKNLSKCRNNSNCYQKQLKNFEQTVEKIYCYFYDQVTKEITHP